MTATVVLVHGAFHHSGYWRGTLKGLADLGVAAVAPDLPGRGSRADEPFTDLAGDADAINEVLDGISGPVVLVGHSYGGAVVTDAGVHDSVVEVVWIAGFCLEEGETVANAGAPADVEGIDHTGRPKLGPALHIDPLTDIATVVNLDQARAVFYSDFDDEQFADIITNLCPHPMANMNQHPRHHVFYEKKSTYVVCSDDMAVHPHHQRVMARRTSRAAAWDSGHFPMITHADKTVRFLAKIAQAYD
jgi:pimeloyl-ACP methyl ester carboxylesterase